MRSNSAFNRGEGTWCAIRRAMAEPRDAFSCTGNFNHRTRGTRRKRAGGSAFQWIAADNFGVENCGESYRDSVWDESVGGGTIDSVSGGNVRRDRSFQHQDVGRRQLGTMFSE